MFSIFHDFPSIPSAMAFYSAIVMLMKVNEFQVQRHSCILAVQFLGYQLLQITGMFVSYFPAELCFFFFPSDDWCIFFIASGEACNDLMAYSLILSCCCYTCCVRGKLRKMLNIKVRSPTKLHWKVPFTWSIQSLSGRMVGWLPFPFDVLLLRTRTRMERSGDPR